MARRDIHTPCKSSVITTPGLSFLALGDNRSWGLALAYKATTQAQCGNNQCQCECNFLHRIPLLLTGLCGSSATKFSVAEAASRPPVHTKKNQIDIRLCVQRDGAKYATAASAAVAAEVRVIVFHKR